MRASRRRWRRPAIESPLGSDASTLSTQDGERASGSSYVFVHGRGGRFEEFSGVVAALGSVTRAYAYSSTDAALVPWDDAEFAAMSARSSRSCIGASVIHASRGLASALAKLGAADLALVGHSKGGSVVLQTLADIAAGTPNPGVTVAVTLDAAISAAAQMGIKLETASKRVADFLARAPVLGFPAAKYSEWFLEYDQLDVEGLRRSIGTIRDAGVPVINIRARSRWSSHVPGVVNVAYNQGGHRAVMDWRFIVKMLAEARGGSG